MTIHTTFRRGKKILIIMNDGEQIVDRYVEKKSGSIVVESRGEIRLSDVRACTIYKPRDA